MIDQIVISITGLTAIGLSQIRSQRISRWASVVGLVGQPFWFYATFMASQWGMFALSFGFTAVWAFGFYNNWIRKEKE